MCGRFWFSQRNPFWKWCVAFAPDVVSRSAEALGVLVISAHKNWKKAKEDYKSHPSRQYHQVCAEKFDAFLNLATMKGMWTWEICLNYLSTNYVLSLAILITSDFSFKALCFHNFSPPSENLGCAPVHTQLCKACSAAQILWLGRVRPLGCRQLL